MDAPDNQSSQSDLADYKRLSKQQLNQRLDVLLSTPANEQKIDEAQFLLHELQVHQIELEIQNLELREAQERLEEARDRYSDLYDFSPVGYITLDRKGIIHNINLTAAAMLGVERLRLEALPFATKLVAGEQGDFFKHLNKVFDSQKKHSFELHLKQPNNHFMVVRLECISVKEVDDEAKTCNCAIIDVTERKHAEDALKEEHDKAQRYLDTVEAMMVALDLDGCITLINRKGCELLGYEEQELLGKNWFETFLPPELKEEVEEVFHELVKGHISVAEYHENLIVTRNGEERFIAWHNKLLCDDSGNVVGTLGAGEDITQRKRAEEETNVLLQQNRDLAQRLFQIQEQERRHLARELHDEYGQWLTALRMHAQVMNQRYSGTDRDIRDSIKIVGDVSEQMLHSIRRIIRDLMPVELDELGLKDSLQELVDQWQKHYPQMRCALSLEGSLDGFNDLLNVTVYRIVQESLTNVAKYAEADNVSIRLRRNGAQAEHGDHLYLSIEDDGQGFDPDKPTKGLGMVGMRERVLAIGGDFVLKSSPGAGVHLEIQLPLTASQKQLNDV